MKLRLYSVAFLIIFITKCQSSEETKGKTLPYFRRQLEENSNSFQTKHAPGEEGHLISVLVNNVKQIFSDIEETTGFLLMPFPTRHRINSDKSTLTTTVSIGNIKEDPNITDVQKYYPNLSLSTVTKFDLVYPGYEIKNANKASLSLQQSEKSVIKSKQKLVQNNTNKVKKNALVTGHKTNVLTNHTNERHCIFCNNVKYRGCDNPDHKQIPTITCERKSDQCYSMHTPFGIIDRGCFNVNYNLTIYVCSCNLCNYIPYTDLPVILTSKLKWAQNVVELSRTRHLKKSVFQDMDCLRCEVNSTSTSNQHKFSVSNCLSGSIGNIPTVRCEPNEICGIKAIKSEGYIWRGCLKSPLYNYYWNLCDGDLCNHDTLLSIYNII